MQQVFTLVGAARRPLARIADAVAVFLLAAVPALAAVLLFYAIADRFTDPERLGEVGVGLLAAAFVPSLLVSIAWLHGDRWRDLAGLAGPATAPWRAFALVGFVVLMAAEGLLEAVVPSVGELFSMPTEPLPYAAMAVYAILLAPPMEELIFRGYLYGRLREVAPAGFTIAVTSVLFALAHHDGGWLYPAVVLPSAFFLGILRERSGTIWPCIAVHAAMNVLAVAYN